MFILYCECSWINDDYDWINAFADAKPANSVQWDETIKLIKNDCDKKEEKSCINGIHLYWNKITVVYGFHWVLFWKLE